MLTDSLTKISDEILEHCDINGNFSCDDKVEKLKLAQLLLKGSIALASEVAEETNNTHAHHYLIDHLKIRVSEKQVPLHNFVFDFDKWIEQIRDKDNEDDSL